jgi:AcrR family transcriptional regulator
MSPRTKREQSVIKIKTAALKLIAAKGYSNTSLEEISNAAGFTKGATYYYFKSKENLIVELLSDIERRSIDVTAQKIHSMDASTDELLIQFIKIQATWAIENPDDIGVLIRMSLGSKDLGSKTLKKVADIYNKITHLLRDIICHGVKNRSVSSKVNIENAVTALTAIHDGNMLLWYRSGRDPEVGRNLVNSLSEALPRVFIPSQD